MSAPTIAPEEIDTDQSVPEMVHLVCECDEERALCGTDVSGDCWYPAAVQAEQRCIVCWDLMSHRCERCGRKYEL